MAETKEDGKGGLSRRDFITAAAGVTVAAGAAKRAEAGVYKSILPSTVLGANELIRTGHIGLGYSCQCRGGGIDELMFSITTERFQPIMLCDTRRSNVEKRVKPMFREKTADAVVVDDFRRVIENRDVDAVVVAMQDHWHCLPVLYAAEAKKAIYCRVPLCSTLAEAHAMRKAIKDNGVVFQGGTVQRSGKHFLKAVEMVRNGCIGKVAWIETFSLDNTYINGIGMGETDATKYTDKGLNWDMDQGWVEHKPFNLNRWINSCMYLDYSGGKIAGWGAHLMDIAMMAMGDDRQPNSVTAVGGKYLMQDSRTTPDTLEVLYRFDDFILSFTNRVWNPLTFDGKQPDHGIVFYGERGILSVNRLGLDVFASKQNQTADKATVTEHIDPETPDQQAALNLPHWQNFADSIRGIAKPNAPIDTLFNTTRICLIGSCAYVAGAHFNSGAKFDGTSMPDEAPAYGQTTLDWDAETQKFAGGNAETVKIANNWAYREYQNGWSLKAPHHA
jgi:predicted dehydrogenase